MPRTYQNRETIIDYCPIRDCSSEAIEIDDNMFRAFKILDKKGYTARFYSSAHSRYCPKTYISFWGNLSFPHLPTGFIIEHKYYVDEDIYVTTISKDYDSKLSGIELQKQIWQTSLCVLNWADSLDCAEQEDDG